MEMREGSPMWNALTLERLFAKCHFCARPMQNTRNKYETNASRKRKQYATQVWQWCNIRFCTKYWRTNDTNKDSLDERGNSCMFTPCSCMLIVCRFVVGRRPDEHDHHFTRSSICGICFSFRMGSALGKRFTLAELSGFSR